MMQHFVCLCCLYINTSKMKYLSILFIAAICFVLVQCKKTAKVTETVFVASPFGCSNTENNKSGDYFICIDTLRDNRCPENVICVWGGYTAVNVNFHEGNNIHSFKMGLKNFVLSGSTFDTTINNYRIILNNILPYPNTSVGNQNNIKKAYFEITHL